MSVVVAQVRIASRQHICASVFLVRRFGRPPPGARPTCAARVKVGTLSVRAGANGAREREGGGIYIDTRYSDNTVKYVVYLLTAYESMNACGDSWKVVSMNSARDGSESARLGECVVFLFSAIIHVTVQWHQCLVGVLPGVFLAIAT